MKLIIAIVRDFKVPEIVDAVEQDSQFPGMTVLDCRGFGREKTRRAEHRPEEELVDFVDRKAILVAASTASAEAIARRIEQVAHTGRPGDGKVFIVPLEQAARIATGDLGEAAIE